MSISTVHVTGNDPPEEVGYLEYPREGQRFGSIIWDQSDQQNQDDPTWLKSRTTLKFDTWYLPKYIYI